MIFQAPARWALHQHSCSWLLHWHVLLFMGIMHDSRWQTMNTVIMEPLQEDGRWYLQISHCWKQPPQTFPNAHLWFLIPSLLMFIVVFRWSQALRSISPDQVLTTSQLLTSPFSWHRTVCTADTARVALLPRPPPTWFVKRRSSDARSELIEIMRNSTKLSLPLCIQCSSFLIELLHAVPFFWPQFAYFPVLQVSMSSVSSVASFGPRVAWMSELYFEAKGGWKDAIKAMQCRETKLFEGSLRCQSQLVEACCIKASVESCRLADSPQTADRQSQLGRWPSNQAGRQVGDDRCIIRIGWHRKVLPMKIESFLDR